MATQILASMAKPMHSFCRPMQTIQTMIITGNFQIWSRHGAKQKTKKDKRRRKPETGKGYENKQTGTERETKSLAAQGIIVVAWLCIFNTTAQLWYCPPICPNKVCWLGSQAASSLDSLVTEYLKGWCHSGCWAPWLLLLVDQNTASPVLSLSGQ